MYFHGASGAASGGLVLWKAPCTEDGVLVVLASSIGRTWDLVLGRLGPDLAALDDVLRQVFAVYRPPRIAFAGFSDGASYALSLGLANGDLVDNVLAFSPGYSAPPTRVGRPRIWVSTAPPTPCCPLNAGADEWSNNCAASITKSTTPS